MIKKSRDWWTKLVSGIIFGITALGIIGWKIANPSVNMKNALIVGGILTIFCAVAFFGNSAFAKMKKASEEEIPDPISQEKLREIVYNEVKARWNMLTIENPIEWIRSKTINKNIIYALKINFVYPIKFGENDEGESCIMIVNANFPEEQPTIINPKVAEGYIDRRMNDKSKSPLDEPEVEERTETDLASGKETKYKKVVPKKKEEKKEGNVV